MFQPPKSLHQGLAFSQSKKTRITTKMTKKAKKFGKWTTVVWTLFTSGASIDSFHFSISTRGRFRLGIPPNRDENKLKKKKKKKFNVRRHENIWQLCPVLKLSRKVKELCPNSARAPETKSPQIFGTKKKAEERLVCRKYPQDRQGGNSRVSKNGRPLVTSFGASH